MISATSIRLVRLVLRMVFGFMDLALGLVFLFGGANAALGVHSGAFLSNRLLGILGALLGVCLWISALLVFLGRSLQAKFRTGVYGFFTIVLTGILAKLTLAERQSMHTEDLHFFLLLWSVFAFGLVGYRIWMQFDKSNFV